jgi:hypothetical protein
MAGLDPAIHIFSPDVKTWMPGKAGHDDRSLE